MALALTSLYAPTVTTGLIMTETDKALIKEIQDMIYSLPAAQCEACNEVAEHMRRVIKQAGEPVGTLALSLLGAEAQSKAL
jgi:hypothetical protein